jgi:hypothetical protein
MLEVEAPLDSAHEGGKVVSPTRRSPLHSQEIPLALISDRGCRPEGHSATGMIKIATVCPVT